MRQKAHMNENKEPFIRLLRLYVASLLQRCYCKPRKSCPHTRNYCCFY